MRNFKRRDFPTCCEVFALEDQREEESLSVLPGLSIIITSTGIFLQEYQGGDVEKITQSEIKKFCKKK